MLRLNKLTDYSTLILDYLAKNPEEVISSSQIAKHTRISLPTVAKLLKLLTTAKIVSSYRGFDGGYSLAKAAENITLAEVVLAVEGPVAITECNNKHSSCDLEQYCGLKNNWQIINTMILDLLNRLTIKDLMRPLVYDAPFSLNGVQHVK